MRVLILGATGHIGSRLAATPSAGDGIDFRSASRHPPRHTASPNSNLRLDSRDETALAVALRDCDAVVNCVAGDPASIAEGAKALVNAALAAGCPSIVHLSTMSVYGRQEGVVTEDSPFDPGLGWYAKAKVAAETEICRFAEHGGEATILRPGCVYGPGSQLWVGRMGRWLATGRFGDLGILGDGWSNLVHVDDVCTAIIRSLQRPTSPGSLATYNLAAADSPRWNEYLIDLARALNAVPVRRLSAKRLKLDAYLAGPPLKILEIVTKRLGISGITLPDPLPPALLRFLAQQIRMDSRLAEKNLGLQWTPYAEGVAQSCSWFAEKHPKVRRPG